MTVQQDVKKSVAPAFIELFVLDLTNIPGLATTIYRLTPSAGDTNPIIWGGNTYYPWPVQIQGIEQNSDGAPARPTLTIGNLDASKIIGATVFAYSDIIGAKVTYIRTFSTYIGGAGSASLSPLKYTIGKKKGHDERFLSFELRSPLDKERAYLPPRQMLKRDFPGLGTNKQYR